MWICAGWLDFGLFFGRVTKVCENDSVEARFLTHLRDMEYSENPRTELFEKNQILDLPFKATYKSKGKWLIDFEGDLNLLFKKWKKEKIRKKQQHKQQQLIIIFQTRVSF